MRDAPRRVAELLTEEHARLHALLARAVLPSGEVDREAYVALRAGLLRHIGIEEKILFPAVREARGGVALGRAAELRVDHGALTSLLVPTPDAALLAELEGLLHAHDAKEEGPEGVYVECERSLGEQGSWAIAERARAYPEVPVAAHYDGPRAYRTAAAALAAQISQRARRGG